MSPYHAMLTQRGSRDTVVLIFTHFGDSFLLIKLECQIVPLANVTVPLVFNKFLVPILSQMNPLYSAPSYLFKIRLNIVFPFFQAVSFRQVCLPKLYIHFCSSPYLPHPPHSPGLYHRIFGEEYKP